ncbi:MAG TPA: hypothetical protein VLX28_09900 [Thermoanaerobaculia bacterium]|nr:hypothetical protein [Thermoanaerobaculia bacterium]
MRNTTIRALLSLILISAWLALLFSGRAFGGAVHLLLAAALAVFPWRAAAKGTTGTAETPGTE